MEVLLNVIKVEVFDGYISAVYRFKCNESFAFHVASVKFESHVNNTIRLLNTFFDFVFNWLSICIESRFASCLVYQITSEFILCSDWEVLVFNVVDKNHLLSCKSHSDVGFLINESCTNPWIQDSLFFVVRVDVSLYELLGSILFDFIEIFKYNCIRSLKEFAVSVKFSGVENKVHADITISCFWLYSKFALDFFSALIFNDSAVKFVVLFALCIVKFCLELIGLIGLQSIIVNVVFYSGVSIDCSDICSCYSILCLCLEVYRFIVESSKVNTVIAVNIELVFNKFSAFVGIAS